MVKEDAAIKPPPAVNLGEVVNRIIPIHPAPPLPPGVNLESRLRHKSLIPIFETLAKHPYSANLPENPFIDNPEAYHAVLPEYQASYQRVKAYNATHPGQNKTDFLDPHNPNVGWKFHLNVTPDHVHAVSQYLIENGYDHKYLSGGGAEDDGKTFTVYIGSKKKIDELASQVSQDLLPHLSRPNDHREIELAPGVVGRFVALDGSKEFDTYGNYGFSFIKKYFDKAHKAMMEKWNEKETAYKSIMKEAAVPSYWRLVEKYGTYFTGESS